MIRISLVLTTFLMSLYAQNSDIMIFDDMADPSEESIFVEENRVSKTIVSTNEDESDEPLIVDDIHDTPSVISTKAYVEADKPKEKAVQIVKYIDSDERLGRYQEPSKKIDFWKLLGVTLQRSATLLLKRHDIEISKANLALIKSEYYPNLSLRYFNEYYHGFSRAGDASIGGSYYPSVSQYRNSLNLQLDYEVYNFGATDLKKAIGEIDTDILKSEIELEKQNIAKELLENYTIALKAQEEMKIKEKIFCIKDQLLKDTKRLYQVGLASRLDMSRLLLERDKISKDILNAKLRYSDALKKIQTLSNIRLDPNGVALAIFNVDKIPLKEFEESAKARNLKLQMDRANRELELLEKQYYPTLSVNASYQLYGSDKDRIFDAIKDIERNNWNVGLVLKWDIFSGFKTKSSLQKKRLELEKLVQQYRIAKEEFNSQKDRHEMLRAMLDRVMRDESKLLEEETMQKEMLSRLHKAGDLSALEVLKSQNRRLDSELSFRVELINQLKEDILSQLL